MYNLDFSILLESKDLIKQGFIMTLYISFFSSLFAFTVGVLVTFLREMPNRKIQVLTTIYTEIVRNIPLLIQLYIIYKALPHFNIVFGAVECGIIALSTYTGAYMAEVLRSGMNSVAPEQKQASYALGFNHAQTFFLVTFPQAIRIVIPTLGSQFINLIKNSSLVSFIAVIDIFYVIYKGAADDFRIYEFFLFGIALYMSLTGIIALITNFLEHTFKVYGREAKV